MMGEKERGGIVLDAVTWRLRAVMTLRLRAGLALRLQAIAADDGLWEAVELTAFGLAATLLAGFVLLTWFQPAFQAAWESGAGFPLCHGVALPG